MAKELSMDEDRERPPIPPGTYTLDTLPAVSLKAEAILQRVQARTHAWREGSEGKAILVKADEAYKRGGLRAAMAIMFGEKK
ncbi:MAG: hypothetical protein JWN64_476 [Parcubacteria group bacterium]|nr:hypothetical protein [Parcubacteria group bacterium]